MIKLKIMVIIEIILLLMILNNNSLKNIEVSNNSKTPIICGDYIYYKRFQINVGSFGKAFFGKNKTTNNKVAVKVTNDNKVNKAASHQ